jgi:DNA polymerase-3 subunit gamma/tau
VSTAVGPYVVLARKYRSKQFSDIVGQLSVVRTLVNAIKLSRTHQAYVFSGSRGIGKTSIARIFSKALRCVNVTEKDGLLYSCDQCSDCIEIAQGNSVNVLEIDGASNNGVDAVREIRENAKFLPTSGKYKIYIIDEVHMLSTAAFNALLKTLEEPPEHVVFIFATTESHKIPETILGRCQRFDFKRMTLAQISDRCKEVLHAEKIEFEDAALNLIARAAEGSMRDALSILDQVISFSGMKVTAKAVRESIGLVGTELVLGLLSDILKRDAKSALQKTQGAFQQGVDLKVLLKVSLEMLHALILMQVGIEKPETHFSDDELKQLATLKAVRPIEENELIFQVFHHGLDLLSRAPQPKLVMDLLVVKTALAESLVSVHGSEGDVHDGDPSPLKPERAGAETLPASAAPAPAEKTRETTSSVVGVSASSSLRSPETVSVDAHSAGSSAPSSMEPADDILSEMARIQAKLQAVASGATPGVGVGLPSRAPAQGADVSPSKPSSTLGSPPEYPRPKWEAFIEKCFDARPVLGVILESVVEHMLPAGPGDTLRIGFRASDQQKSDQIQQKSLRDQFLSYFELQYGFKPQFEVFVSSHQGESLAERTARLKNEAREQKLKSILANEIVQEAKALFGGELTQIEILGH